MEIEGYKSMPTDENGKISSPVEYVNQLSERFQNGDEIGPDDIARLNATLRSGLPTGPMSTESPILRAFTDNLWSQAGVTQVFSPWQYGNNKLVNPTFGPSDLVDLTDQFFNSPDSDYYKSTLRTNQLMMQHRNHLHFTFK